MGGVAIKAAWKRLSYWRKITGIEVLPNCIGPGVQFPHGKVVINKNAILGANCKVLSDVTIGINGKKNISAAPHIGCRVYIGSGARILGDITIADDVVIGANSVVVKSITEPGTTWAGNPARKIKDTGSQEYI